MLPSYSSIFFLYVLYSHLNLIGSFGRLTMATSPLLPVPVRDEAAPGGAEDV